MNVHQDVVKAITVLNKSFVTRIAKLITIACTLPVAVTATARRTSFAKETKASVTSVMIIQNASLEYVNNISVSLLLRTTGRNKY